MIVRSTVLLRALLSVLLLGALLPLPASLAQETDVLHCPPGEPTRITGDDTPEAALLLLFNGRVVGGGTVPPDGHYTLTLTVGAEAPGQYPVLVERRSDRKRLRTLTCVVPTEAELVAWRAAQATARAQTAAPTMVAPTELPAAPAAPAASVVPAAPSQGDDLTGAGGTAPTVSPGASGTAPGLPGAPTPGEPVPGTTPTFRPGAPQRQVQGAAPQGWAELTQDAPLLSAVPPRGPSDTVATYPGGTRVRLLGQALQRWVQVQPAGAATTGWMDAAALRLITSTPGPEPTSTPTPTLLATATLTATTAPTPTPTVTATITVTPTGAPGSGAALPQGVQPVGIALLPPLVPTAGAVQPPVARTITVVVCRVERAASQTCKTPLAGVPVTLLLVATEERLASGVTGGDGQATLAVSVPAGARLLLRLPTFGLQLRLGDQDQTVRVPLPAALFMHSGGGA